MKKFILGMLLMPAISFADGWSTFHINSKVEMSENPGTQFELGEMTSARSIVYFGFLQPNKQRSNLDVDREIEVDLKYAYTRVDYHFNGVLEDGFYIGMALSYSEAEYTIDEKEDKASGAGLGAQVGYNLKLKNFTVGTSLKANHFAYEIEREYQTNNKSEYFDLPHHETVVASLNLGYKF